MLLAAHLPLMALSARAAPKSNGLDAWRIVTGEVSKGRARRLLALRDGVEKPQAIRNYADAPDFPNRYATNLQEYEAAKPRDISIHGDLELQQSWRRAFPPDIREALILMGFDLGTLLPAVTTRNP